MSYVTNTNVYADANLYMWVIFKCGKNNSLQQVISNLAFLCFSYFIVFIVQFSASAHAYPTWNGCIMAHIMWKWEMRVYGYSSNQFSCEFTKKSFRNFCLKSSCYVSNLTGIFFKLAVALTNTGIEQPVVIWNSMTCKQRFRNKEMISMVSLVWDTC